MGSKPEDIDPSEFEELQARLRAYEDGPKIAWAEGDGFVVTHGPFKGFRGTVNAVENEGERLLTTVRIFGRDTPIQLHPMDIEAAQ